MVNSVMPNVAGRVAAVSYFKRYKMEADLRELPSPRPPPGLRFLPWNPDLLDAHAEALHDSFRLELDAVVFPSLGDRTGCVNLMNAITRRFGFTPEATWLLVGDAGPCGTVQGLRERGMGAVQNLGVAPAWRGRGLGEALLLQALHGFRQAGLGRAVLEVTARNEAALRLYRRVGFRSRKTVYKAVPEIREEG